MQRTTCSCLRYGAADMTGLSGVATGKEMVAVVTKGVFRLLKNNATTFHRHLKIIAFSANVTTAELPLELGKASLTFASTYPLQIYCEHRNVPCSCRVTHTVQSY
jgi:hypothetical protein